MNLYLVAIICWVFCLLVLTPSAHVLTPSAHVLTDTILFRF